jgi:broad specificity phosphatase PhoE
MPVYHSDLPRAAATARFIVRAWETEAAASAATAEAAGRSPSQATQPLLTADARLREIHLGEYEGASWERFEADKELMAAFERDAYGTAVPGGESLAHLSGRVMAAVRDILTAHGVSDVTGLSTDAVAASDASALATGFRRPGKSDSVCIVAHDGPIRAVLNHYLGVPPEKWWTLSTTHGGVSLLEFSDGWVNVRYMNAAEHLAGLEPDVYVPAMDDPGVDAGDEPPALAG